LSTDNKRVVRRLYEEVLGRGDFSALEEIVAPDVITEYQSRPDRLPLLIELGSLGQFAAHFAPRPVPST
jgi:ketosteroid isomerase-like protein